MRERVFHSVARAPRGRPRASQPSLPPLSLFPVHPDSTPAAPAKFCRKNSAAAMPLTAAPLSSPQRVSFGAR